MSETRFEEASEHAYVLIRKCIRDSFLELEDAKILVLMDTKERQLGGKITLGRILKTNDLTRHLTIDESGSDQGYDYIIFLDKLMWDNTEDVDRLRIISHELSHTVVEDDKYRLRIHTIEDFFSEVKRNEKDPRWRERVGMMLVAKYEELKTKQIKLPL